jgi:hypothetical protein
MPPYRLNIPAQPVKMYYRSGYPHGNIVAPGVKIGNGCHFGCNHQDLYGDKMYKPASKSGWF